MLGDVAEHERLLGLGEREHRGARAVGVALAEDRAFESMSSGRSRPSRSTRPTANGITNGCFAAWPGRGRTDCFTCSV